MQSLQSIRNSAPRRGAARSAELAEQGHAEGASSCSAALESRCGNRAEMMQSYLGLSLVRLEKNSSALFREAAESEEPETRGDRERALRLWHSRNEVVSNVAYEPSVAESTSFQEDSDMQARAAQHHRSASPPGGENGGVSMDSCFRLLELALARRFYGLTPPARNLRCRSPTTLRGRATAAAPVGDRAVWERAELVISEIEDAGGQESPDCDPAASRAAPAPPTARLGGPESAACRTVARLGPVVIPGTDLFIYRSHE